MAGGELLENLLWLNSSGVVPILFITTDCFAIHNMTMSLGEGAYKAHTPKKARQNACFH